MDQSELDEKYFIDKYVYNCPFCKRRHVSYTLESTFSFDWSNQHTCYVYFVLCDSCKKVSMHLSFTSLSSGYGHLVVEDIDSHIIYSRPTSFFTLDDSIPKTIRELISEAEEAVQFNLKTGASAALRKAIYTLLKKEDSIVVNNKTNRTNYKASIEKLRDKFTFVNADLFDTLSAIQGLASNPVHEDAWEAWDNKMLHFLIELTKSILNEIYAIPKQRAKKKAQLDEMKKALEPKKENIESKG